MSLKCWHFLKRPAVFSNGVVLFQREGSSATFQRQESGSSPRACRTLFSTVGAGPSVGGGSGVEN
jgi:hypothetical protein